MHLCISKTETVCNALMEAPQRRKKKLGLLGGTFNPVHYGHLDIALHARDLFSLDRVALLPLGTPPHKPANSLTPGDQRFEMVCRAVEGTPLEAWDLEIIRPGPTYTVDTLEILNGALGEEYEFFYIVGADTLMDAPTWCNPLRVFELCTFLAFYRPGQRVEDVMRQASTLTECYNAKVSLAPHTGPDISSTMIKRRVARGEDISAYVPASVAEYIARTGLYRSCGNG